MPDRKPRPIGSPKSAPNDILFEKAKSKKKSQTAPTQSVHPPAPAHSGEPEQRAVSTLRELVSTRFSNGAPMFYMLEGGEIVCSKNAPVEVKKQFYLMLYKSAHKMLDQRASKMNTDEMLASNLPQQQAFAKAYAMALSALSGSDYSRTHYIAFHARTQHGWLMFMLPNNETVFDQQELQGPFCFVNDEGKVFLQKRIDGAEDIEGTVFANAIATMERADFPLPFRNRPIQLGERLA